MGATVRGPEGGLAWAMPPCMYRISPGIVGMYGISPGIVGMYRISPGIAGMYGISPGIGDQDTMQRAHMNVHIPGQ